MTARSAFPIISISSLVFLLACVFSLEVFTLPAANAQAIQHDAEHYVLLHQYKDQWAAEDQEIGELPKAP